MKRVNVFGSLLKRGVTGVLLVLLLPIAAFAGPEGFRFDVYLSGFRVGEVRFVGKTDGARYEMQGVMGSKGFFGGFINRRYSGAVIGEQRGARLRPSVFRGRYEQRRQYAQVDIRYAGTTPSEVVRTPPRDPQPHDISLSAARNTLDPISGTFFLLRDQNKKSLCSQNFRVFEGNRVARINLSATSEASEDKIICNGSYRRIGGFTKAQMEDRVTFPFQLHYVPVDAAGDIWRVSEFSMTTYWGTAKALRKQ